MSMTNALGPWLGTYRLVVSSELLGFIESAFVATAPASEHDSVRAEALAEAHSATLEIRADGSLRSCALGAELYAVVLPPLLAPVAELAFEKRPGEPVTLRLVAPDTLLALQPGKPVAEFRRQK